MSRARRRGWWMGRRSTRAPGCSAWCKRARSPASCRVATDATLSLAEVAMYVPLLVLRQFKDARHVPLPYEERVRGALLFADVSGFTKLTQALQASSLGLARGAEVLNDILSNYFNVLIECFHEHGGDVVSFSGDAMTVLFEASEEAGAPACLSSGRRVDRGRRGLAAAARRRRWTTRRCRRRRCARCAARSTCSAASTARSRGSVRLQRRAAQGVRPRCAQDHAPLWNGRRRDAGASRPRVARRVGRRRRARQRREPGAAQSRRLRVDETALRSLKESEERAASGECVVPPTMWKLVEGAVEATVDADGYVALHPPFRARAARRIGRRATTQSLPSWRRRLRATRNRGCVASRVTCAWACQGHAARGAEELARRARPGVASIVFMRILSINNDTALTSSTRLNTCSLRCTRR